MASLFKYAWKEIKRRKKRSISTLFGYAVAVAVMVILISFVIYANSNDEKILHGVGTRFIAFIPSETCECTVPSVSEEYSDFNEGFVAFTSYTKLIEPSVLDKINAISVINDVSPFISYRMLNRINDALYVTVGGLDTLNKNAVYKNCCAPTDVIEGRFIQDGELDVVMVEQAYADAANIKVGDNIEIQDKSFEVIGIVNTEMKPAKADVYMNIEDASNVVNKKVRGALNGSFNSLLIVATDARILEKAAEEVQLVLGDDSVTSTSSCYQFATKAMGINDKTIYIAFIIILGITMLYSIKTQHGNIVERYHDMGILKAIGWMNRDILGMIFLESTIQSILGGIIGCIVATIVIVTVPFGQWIDFVPGELYVLMSWNALLLGMAIAIICGSLAAIVSGLSIINKEPVDILKKL